MAETALDDLPVELKILILFQVPDGGTLKSLVHASPGYHQVYLAVRNPLLRLLVKRQYNGFLDLAEALTAIRSKGVRYAYQDEKVICLLDNWRRRNEIRQIGQSSSNRLDEPDSLEETIKLLHFHKMLRFFLEGFSNNAPRPPFIEPVQWEREYLPLSLSVSEKRRFLRAICRFQILKNIFGEPVQCLDHPECDTCGDWGKYWQLKVDDVSVDSEVVRVEAYHLFYGPMPLWEHDELGSVFGYLITKIEGIAKEIANDLRQLSKNTPCEFFWDIFAEEQRLPAGCDIDSERDLVHFDQHYEGLAGLGPEFIYHILHMDRLSRRNIVCVNTRGFWPGPFIGYGVELSQSIQFPFIDPADRLDSPNFEQFWSTLLPLEQPTVGWKKAWLLPLSQGDNLDDSMNHDREKDKDWDWSYALWDERRLKEWKAPLVEEDGPFNSPGRRIS
ncbi:uncharacterized protein KD926_007883 [Aspergillus affinis]|uniref:uncharacterized protein n=1 Tax=Aspergillus affinis TaxID=1070780 RepID=UPI0022FF42E4|nr:uncharacterized protein KD926_007883 [Aspergillus affinis]KAI9040667.1 hypothetical protein KD926_007883 [Aspergillus affinis]